MRTLSFGETTDKVLLREHFLHDPVLFAYHLGDLDDFFFPDCRWLTVSIRDGSLVEALLIYSVGSMPTVLGFGRTDDFTCLIHRAAEHLPERFYCHFHGEHQSVWCEYFDEQPLGTHQKMRLDSFRSVAAEADESAIVRLDLTHVGELNEFYAEAYPDNYFVPRMLDTGKYLGWREDGRLVAVCGVHVYSPEYNIAVLGNIATLPDYRGRGIGTRLTSKLCEELTHEGRLVCLNVKAHNEPALRSYRKLGFVTVCDYEEAVFTRKS